MLLVVAFFIALYLAVNGKRKRSLSASGSQEGFQCFILSFFWHASPDQRSHELAGALAAFVIGMAHMASGTRFGATLIIFYLTSSKVSMATDP